MVSIWCLVVCRAPSSCEWCANLPDEVLVLVVIKFVFLFIIEFLFLLIFLSFSFFFAIKFSLKFGPTSQAKKSKEIRQIRPH